MDYSNWSIGDGANLPVSKGGRFRMFHRRVAEKLERSFQLGSSLALAIWFQAEYQLQSRESR